MASTSAADASAALDGQKKPAPLSEQVPDEDVAMVAGAFARVLNVKSVAPDDDIFQLGADSLIAAALMVEIETEYGVRMSISALIGASTPRALASVILAASTSQRVGSVLVPARLTGSGTPLFCVHGQRGELIFPRKLSRVLKGDRPVYAFRAMGLEANERPLATVPAMAARYLAAAREVQPTGPYLFLGICGGSLVAYEMAQQLSAAGEVTAGLILIDPPSHPNLAPFLYESGAVLARHHQSWTARAAKIEAAFANNSWMTVEIRRGGVRELMSASVGRYVPTPFQGETLFLCSSDKTFAYTSDFEILFAAYSPLLGHCDFVHLESGHNELFTDRLDDLARSIDSFIDRLPRSN